ncbi:hypothetical protein ANN_16324 [Periplaneta americana]|uniref:Uncharacterized protein n=1 Tax=Periplaneta americana TaxID=6978 RepID=A0ABQ8SIN1_PERAM|nr:hypothetical protein ANN_16324 [Periplaneta americana]
MAGLCEGGNEPPGSLKAKSLIERIEKRTLQWYGHVKKDERRKMAKDYSGTVTSGKEEACETKKNMESWCHANDEGPTHVGGGLAGSRRMAEGNSGQLLKSGEAHKSKVKYILGRK